MLNLRRFDEEEYDTFQGAEDFADGHAPLVAEFKVTERIAGIPEKTIYDLQIIFSKTGAELIGVDDTRDVARFQVEPGEGINLLAQLTETIALADFRLFFEAGILT